MKGARRNSVAEEKEKNLEEGRKRRKWRMCAGKNGKGEGKKLKGEEKRGQENTFGGG